MKKLLGIAFVLLVIYTMYYDVKFGTLPQPTEATIEPQEENAVPAKEVKIERGETVLSVVEQLNRNHRRPIPEIVSDFERLNPGINANQLQTGETYRFPLYGNSR